MYNLRTVITARNLSKSTLRLATRYYSQIPLSVPITLPNGITYEQPTGLFINNEFVHSHESKSFEVISPSTEETICEVAEARASDVDAAVEAAHNAFENTNWATQDPIERGKVLYKLADLIDANAELLASIESLDNGKSLLCSRNDIKLVGNYIRSCAGWCDKVNGSVLETGSTHFNFTRREPIGVCGQIIPWNFPLLMWSWKIGPALATGNTVVIKTAEATPLSALYAAKLCVEAGVPAGVVNVVSGFGKICGEAISKHPKVKKIAFTGSTATGVHIMKAAAENGVKKVTLELGGKSPNIVFNDADIERAVQSIILGIFYNSGEVCSAGSRLYVQSGVYDELLAAFSKASNELKVGNPFSEETFQGAQTSQMQLDKILDYVKIGKEEGARLVAGGERIGDKGFFVKPTIFADVKQNMRIVKEEIFGPVIAVTKFDTVEEVIKLANDSEYGLAAGLHTSDINKAVAVAKRVKAGTVWINTYNDFHQSVPFGGFGQSGIGREMGAEALDNYTQPKAVRIAINEQLK